MDTELLTEAFQIGLKQSIFNEAMRSARIGLGLRQSDLAKKCGTTGCTISSIEGFRKYPEEKMQKKISKVLGQPQEKLFPKWLEIYKLPTSTVTKVIEYVPNEIMWSEKPLLDFPKTIEETAEEGIIANTILKALDVTLSDREKKVIKMRFGLDGYRQYTLEEVGKEFMVSKERVRQMEAKALAKLRKGEARPMLRELLDNR